MNKKNIKKYLKFLLIILLLLCFVLLIIKKNKANNEIKTQEQHVKEYLEEELPPRNIMVLYNYKGQLDRNELYKSFKLFTNYISDINSNLKDSTDEQYEQFFSINKLEIRQYLGIQENSKFISFMNYLKDKDVNVSKLLYAEIKIDSEYTRANYFWFTLNLYYGDEEKTICVPFKTGFAQMENALIKVKYDIPDNNS